MSYRERLFTAICDALYTPSSAGSTARIPSLDLIRIISRLAERPEQLVVCTKTKLHALGVRPPARFSSRTATATGTNTDEEDRDVIRDADCDVLGVRKSDDGDWEFALPLSIPMRLNVPGGGGGAGAGAGTPGDTDTILEVEALSLNPATGDLATANTDWAQWPSLPTPQDPNYESLVVLDDCLYFGCNEIMGETKRISAASIGMG